ncbi:MAG TPA: precorrin-3B C(17)-methyltransferase [Stellaceae bacterium]|nr:precorrin-3B C(17)-methyltransferase [Stellaceae bacterium]
MNAPLPEGAAIVALSVSGLTLARRIAALLPRARLHAPAGLCGKGETGFAQAVPHIAALFASGTPIVGVCAAGILIRAVAGTLGDKRTEPAVVAVAEDGSVVVPLLGGHHGANSLARAIAAALAGVAAITTASELRLGLSLEAPPPGWRIANPARIKPVTAALLAGMPVALQGEAPWLDGIRFTDGATTKIRVSAHRLAPDEEALVFHPPVLALGVGTERGADGAELIALVETMLAETGYAGEAIASVVSIDLKTDEKAVHDLAWHLGVPARFFPASSLAAETNRLQTPSARVYAETGCYGVAEGAALAAVGPTGKLLVPKRKSARTTCALAQSPSALDAAMIGRAQGSLAIIGIGPGDAAWRTHEADAALKGAEDIVGYRLYLDLLGDAIAGKPRHESPLGEEEARARLALDLASEGKRVALVSSGDAGIYGLATLVFELLDREDRPAWARVAIGVVPGISALQAAAARLGAPLGHDFCAISLSDLLTPWDVIERRLAAAASGDFVVALYNPRSARRCDQLSRARDILLTHRAPSTPVALARNLGREGEGITLTELGRLEVETVDMLTLVLIGSRATRQIMAAGPRLYTPRGYARKREADAP